MYVSEHACMRAIMHVILCVNLYILSYVRVHIYVYVCLYLCICTYYRLNFWNVLHIFTVPLNIDGNVL